MKQFINSVIWGLIIFGALFFLHSQGFFREDVPLPYIIGFALVIFAFLLAGLGRKTK